MSLLRILGKHRREQFEFLSTYQGIARFLARVIQDRCYVIFQHIFRDGTQHLTSRCGRQSCLGRRNFLCVVDFNGGLDLAIRASLALVPESSSLGSFSERTKQENGQ